jgi:hypothetical protein
VQVSPPQAGDVSVRYSVTGTALYGTDYFNQPPASSVVVPSGTGFAQVAVWPEYRSSAGFDAVAIFTLLPDAGYTVDTNHSTVSIPLMDNFASGTFKVVAKDVPGLVDVGYSGALNALILSMNWPHGCPNNFGLLAPSGALTRFAPTLFPFDGEVNIATVKADAGGLTAGYMFFLVESRGVLGWVSPDGQETQPGSNHELFWGAVPISTVGGVGDVYCDQTGLWGNQLLAVEGGGGPGGAAYRFYSAGTDLKETARIATLPIGCNEGLLTLPNEARYGPWAAKLITSDELSQTIYSISPEGQVDPPWQIGVTGQKFLVIPSNLSGWNLYCIDAAGPGHGWVIEVPGTLFTGHEGDILAFQCPEQLGAPFQAALFIIRWNGTNFETWPLLCGDLPIPQGWLERGDFAPFDVPEAQ